jgi:hypothetical protein
MFEPKDWIDKMTGGIYAGQINFSIHNSSGIPLFASIRTAKYNRLE